MPTVYVYAPFTGRITGLDNYESSAKSPNFTNPMLGVEAAGRPEVAIAAPESPE